jgi:hypothetical protein
MGYVQEPEGIDFYVDSTPLTEKERKEISEIIAYYKLTGQKTKISSLHSQKAASANTTKGHPIEK